MFCNSCGATNPDDAAFCSACGNPVARPPAAVPPPRDLPQAAPVTAASNAPRPEAVRSTPIVSVPVAAEAPRAARASGKKTRRVKWGQIAAAVVVVSFFLYPLAGGSGGICDASRDLVIQQVPPAVEILAARYPLQVGLLRSAFNDQGAVDNAAQDYVRTSMLDPQNPGLFTCYLSYYVVMFDKDQVRTAIADAIERRLALK
jgi:hypothetical protein